MADVYINKTELTDRWSKSLVKKYGKLCLVGTKPNPYGGPDIYMYSLAAVLKVEQLPEFVEELARINRQRTRL